MGWIRSHYRTSGAIGKGWRGPSPPARANSLALKEIFCGRRELMIN